jgi:hypothetical protein
MPPTEPTADAWSVEAIAGRLRPHWHTGGNVYAAAIGAIEGVHLGAGFTTAEQARITLNVLAALDEVTAEPRETGAL